MTVPGAASINHNAQPGADGRHWQSWHLRFPRYQERLVRMAQHLRTDEARMGVAALRLRDSLDDWVERGPERRRVARRRLPTKASAAVGG